MALVISACTIAVGVGLGVGFGVDGFGVGVETAVASGADVGTTVAEGVEVAKGVATTIGLSLRKGFGLDVKFEPCEAAEAIPITASKPTPIPKRIFFMSSFYQKGIKLI